ncbi:large subunit ribosomal protein L19 [Geosmithia morbida]|uniref:Large subunit ribosomal protein L19 n=1 Tax=Geosmithia morbida TaxID=1094350 RepID=A0A9P4YQI3_9HYPO|nr:large subunit ribosomal protein L19 [Geosmithia morbida]KAF4121268.1 large subunit ribosomal protein L19 [Geosmithia morbida]
MNVAGMRHSTGCLKAALRQVRWQRANVRSFTSTSTTWAGNTPSAFSGRQREEIEKVSNFKVWPQVPSVRKTHPNPMPAIHEQQIAKLDPTGARTRLFSKKYPDSANVGDVLMVTPRSGEPFAGVLMQIRRRGVDTAIQLRGQLMRVSTEMWYKIYSPTVTAIDIIWRRPKRARRARLTYLRKPQHDMGNVDNLVFAWKKERHALRGKHRSR